MKRDRRRLFWLEAGAAGASAVLAAVTLLWKDWIEMVFGFDPDGGSGSLEWLIVLGLATTAAGLSVVARREWRRAYVARSET